MATLFDIAPATESVTVSGHALPVYGVSASSILMILGRFPELVDAYRDGETDIMKILLRHGGSALAALIAAALGHPGDAKAERHAALLPADAQIEIASAAIRLTMPDGAVPFLQKIEALFATFGLVVSAAPPSETFSTASEPSRPLSNGHDSPYSNGVPVQ